MPHKSLSGSVSTPQLDFGIDMGNYFLNRVVDGFLKIGTVAASKTAAEGVYHAASKGSISKKNAEHTLKKMCKEGGYWGTVAGVYEGMEYGVGQIRGTNDWKNAMIGGAITGALMAAVTSQDRDKVVKDAIAGGAIATAINYMNINWMDLNPRHHRHHVV
ncbi:hypothetical protein ACFE04_014186 [Oxalis oulophora]